MTIMGKNLSSDPSASRIAEQRLREWTLQLEAQQRNAEEASARELAAQIRPYVTISREAGAAGGEIARRAGEMLGWDVLDRELLDLMAEKFQLPRSALGLVDERNSFWSVEVFGKWLEPCLVTQSEYILHLGQIILLAAQNTNSVFVGRGAQFLLPAEKGLTIYIVAPLRDRIRHVQEFLNCSEDHARRYIRDTDKGRRHLVKTHFDKQIGDPHLYDLVINRAHTSIDEAAELIAEQCRSRFADF